MAGGDTVLKGFIVVPLYFMCGYETLILMLPSMTGSPEVNIASGEGERHAVVASEMYSRPLERYKPLNSSPPPSLNDGQAHSAFLPQTHFICIPNTVLSE